MNKSPRPPSNSARRRSMRRGRPKAELVLSKSEQERLESMARRSRSAPHLARRARIILKCAEEVDNQTVAHKLRVTPQMVGKWRARFVSERLEGLDDEPRPGAPAPGRRCAGGRRDCAHARIHAARRHPLEHTLDGGRRRDEPHDGPAHLESLWSPAASQHDL